MSEGIAVSPAPVESPGTAATLAWRLSPVAVALGSLALSTIALGSRSLTTAEAASLEAADRPLGTVISAIVHDEPGRAGHLLLLRLATTLGSDEWVIRLPSAIAVSLAAGLLVILGTMLLGRVAGIVAGVALAANAGVVEASREARPAALGILGIVGATLLFLVALERGGGWRWVPYAIAAAILPLTHPLAAAVLAAHGATLIARRDRADLRSAGIALVAGSAVATLLLGWMAVDRFDATSDDATLDLDSLGKGLAHVGGWNPILALAALAGLIVLFGPWRDPLGTWVGVLVAALIGAPIVATLIAAVALPVHVDALVLGAPGVALAVGAVAIPLSPIRGLVAAGVAVLLLSSAITIAVRQTADVDEDWRALAAAVKQVKGPKETVVVLPEGSRAAFVYYAPSLATIRFARGDGAWVAVRASSADEAIEASRSAVPTPRYALLRQFRYGEGLRLQHWVRP